MLDLAFVVSSLDAKIAKRRKRQRIYTRKLTRKEKLLRMLTVVKKEDGGCLDLLAAAAVTLDQEETRVSTSAVVIPSLSLSAWSQSRKEANKAADARRRTAQAEAARKQLVQDNNELAAEIEEAADAERVLRSCLRDAKDTPCEEMVEEMVARLRWKYSHQWAEKVLELARIDCDKDEVLWVAQIDCDKEEVEEVLWVAHIECDKEEAD